MFSSVFPSIVFLVCLFSLSLCVSVCVCLGVVFHHLQRPIYIHTCDPSSNQRLQYLYPGSSCQSSPDHTVFFRGTMLRPTQFCSLRIASCFWKPSCTSCPLLLVHSACFTLASLQFVTSLASHTALPASPPAHCHLCLSCENVFTCQLKSLILRIVATLGNKKFIRVFTGSGSHCHILCLH